MPAREELAAQLLRLDVDVTDDAPRDLEVDTRDVRPVGGAELGALLSAERVAKRYGGIHALEDASLWIRRSEVHAILGENGAGKSTLVKIVAGVVARDAGELRLDGETFDPTSPENAQDAGIAVVYQELSLIPELTVAHNLLLRRLPRRVGVVSLREANRRSEEVLSDLGLTHIDPRSRVADLPLDTRQMIEIARATMVRSKLLILDEATSSLGAPAVERLFALVRNLRAAGTTVVVITHRMREVWQLADSMTVLRDGRTVGSFRVGEVSQREAVALMAGRDVHTIFPEKRTSPGAPALELRDVRLRRDSRPFSLDLRRGEILGLGGLEGQGQRELLAWLYGAGPGSGSVLRDGRPLKVKGPAEALRHGIVMIPEDRKAEGLHLELPVRWNLAMATLRERTRFGVILARAERDFAARVVEDLSIKIDSAFQPASALSGGTQQKVVIGKFLACRPSVVLFVDPTRGIDVQTKFAFYAMLRQLASKDGTACVLYSSDTEELVGLCDRVAVFHDGATARMLEADEITLDAVVAASFAVGTGA